MRSSPPCRSPMRNSRAVSRRPPRRMSTKRRRQDPGCGGRRRGTRPSRPTEAPAGSVKRLPLYRPAAQRELGQMDRSEAGRIIRALEAFAASGCGDVRALKGALKGRYRPRVGKWRIFFTLDQPGRVIVTGIDKRGQARSQLRHSPAWDSLLIAILAGALTAHFGHCLQWIRWCPGALLLLCSCSAWLRSGCRPAWCVGAP
jgi:mRNA-degrading endonuclease RelE of RelBE toxin-antitoxin system